MIDTFQAHLDDVDGAIINPESPLVDPSRSFFAAANVAPLSGVAFARLCRHPARY